MIKRLIFDVDGTLIVGADFTPSVEKTLKQLGVYSEDNVKAFFRGDATYKMEFNHYDFNEYIQHIGYEMNEQLPINFLDVLFENLKTAIPQKNQKLIDSISELSKKYELVLLTNYFSESQLNRLNNMGIGRFFSECYGEELIKPNLEAYLKACGNNKPDECIMIGDDIYLDIEGAKRAGLYTIFVNSKNISVDDIDTVVVDKVEDITQELIENIIK